MVSFIIGAKQGGSEVADHADSIDTLIEVNESGTTKVDFRPSSTNPGQETLAFIEENFPDAKAIITSLMQGPPNSKIEVIQEQNKGVNELIEKYKQAYLSSEGESEEKEESEEQYNVPKKRGGGRGTREEKGRNPECEPEKYKETGQGSETQYGRAAEAKPQKKANSGEGNISGLVDKYTNARTDEEKEKAINGLVNKYTNIKTDTKKEEAIQATEKYVIEASKKNLKGGEAEAYVAKRLEEDGYSNSNSEDSSELQEVSENSE